MNKSFFHHVAAVVIFILWATPQVCQANPIVFDPWGDLQNLFEIVIFDALVDLVVLVISFFILREHVYLNIYDFPKYFLAVVVGGLSIDIFVIVIQNPDIALVAIGSMLMIYNMILCLSFFKIHLAKAAAVGFAMGVLTNPVIWAPLIESRMGVF